MYKPEECTKMMEGTLKKERASFSQQEKRILNNIIKDNLMGRYNSLIRFDATEIREFLQWMAGEKIDYFLCQIPSDGQ